MKKKPPKKKSEMMAKKKKKKKKKAKKSTAKSTTSKEPAFLSAGRAKNVATRAIAAAKRKKKQEAEEWKNKDRETYDRARKINDYALRDFLTKIKKRAEQGKKDYTQRSRDGDRNTRTVSPYIQGEYHGFRDKLEELGYQVTCMEKSRYEPDCDGVGDSYNWMEIHVKW